MLRSPRVWRCSVVAAGSSSLLTGGESADLGDVGDLLCRKALGNGTGIPSGCKAFCAAVPNLNPSCMAFGQSEVEESDELT